MINDTLDNVKLSTKQKFVCFYVSMRAFQERHLRAAGATTPCPFALKINKGMEAIRAWPEGTIDRHQLEEGEQYVYMHIHIVFTHIQ